MKEDLSAEGSNIGTKSAMPGARSERKDFSRLSPAKGNDGGVFIYTLYMKGSPKVRKLLGSIVSDKNAENWWKPELFEHNTRSRLPKELEILEAPPQADVNYNCFIYALGFQKDPQYLGESNFGFQNLEKLFQTLIRRGELKCLEGPEIGALIVYRTNDHHISHVGLIWKNGKVLSKWSWGPLLEHGVFDIPDHYGDIVEFYTGLESARRATQILRDTQI